ncbi:hypothetical protein K469DRAFT_685757 [Zopfia rhizophila CBS 207.26]|uniref:Uncharacterized protein n=1 Tax=Zopfia rhizophila CBS 207.26 TaxID=1314779 RepID=A0A6A6D6N4_9PEZI|nr:hypothetical protein K469DRAFT_685757 [Zopfia rhizophila CBS 207.26]
MSDSEATVEDPTMHQDIGTSLLVKPDGSNEAVTTTEQLAPERKSDLGSGKVNTEGRVTKHSPYKMKQSSPYKLLDARMNALVDQLRQKLAQQDARISSLEKNNSYIMRHLGEVDDRLDYFESDTEETENINEKVKAEIRCSKMGEDETDQRDERGKDKKKGQ